MNVCVIVICLLTIIVPSVLYADLSKAPIKIEGDSFGVVIFNHNDHFDYLGKTVCTICHQEVFSLERSENPVFTMKDMEEGKSCGACHNGEQAFDVKNNCSSCHPITEITYKVPDAGNVEFSHDDHISIFNCNECHPDIYMPGPMNNPATMDDMAEGQSCGACHDGITAFTVQENCEICHGM